MYTVFLVEDESLIRESIKNLISWEKYGFNFVGEAPDGEMAWPAIQKLKPDVVITDIKMPFMDGLALSRLVKSEISETTIVILSGHDDFAYAKQAISIGVSEYLLKPISKNQFIEALQKIKQQLDKQNEQKEYLSRFKTEMQEYLTSSRRDFLDALVSGRYNTAELLQRASALQLDLTAQSYNIVLFLLEEDLVQSGYSAALANVQKDLCQCFPKANHIVMFSQGVDIILFLIKSDEAEINACTQDCVKTLEQICGPLHNAMRWSVIVGEPVHRLSSVVNCYQAVRRKMFYRDSTISENNNNISPFKKPVIDFNPNDLDATKVDQRIIEKFLENGLESEIGEFVKNYFDAIGKKAIKSMLFRQYIILNFQFTVNAFIKKIGEQQEDINANLQQAIGSVEQAEKYVEEILTKALEIRERIVNRRYFGMMQKAVSYIKKEYTNSEINLNTVAQFANVSPTHFSSVFSQKTGKTFIEYVTALRMEKARTLLRGSDMTSGDIAFAVGYNDPHYFSFLFKKINGISPRDYRLGREIRE